MASPTKEPMHVQHERGFSPIFGPAPFAFDGEELLENSDGALIRRDTALAELSRLPLKQVTSFAILRDRSLAVVAEARLHHVIGNEVAASYGPSRAIVLPTESAVELWQLNARGVSRDRFGEGKAAKLLMPTAVYSFPEGNLPGVASLADGSIAVSNQSAILHADAHSLKSYSWDGYSRHLAPGPEPRTLWASHGLDKVALVRLEGANVRTLAMHSLRPTETIVHMAGSGEHAAVVVASPTGDATLVAFALVLFNARGEQWRSALAEKPRYFMVAMSATRVVLRFSSVPPQPSYELRAWDLASGKPA